MTGIQVLLVRQLLDIALLPVHVLVFLVRRGAIRRDLRRLIEDSSRRGSRA
jgi:hypothetical protein